jgi:hypothetical protein
MPSKRAVRHPRPRQWGQWCSLLTLFALGSPVAHASAPPDSAHAKAASPEPTPAPRRALFAPPLGPTTPTRVASYTLAARLDENEHRVSAKGQVTWTNTSSVATSELYFHLYLNAFRNDRTRFLRSPFTGSRSARQLGRPGSVTVTRLTSKRFGGDDLWARADKHTPGDAEDATDIRLPLPEPVAPGETVSFDIEFTADLPEIVERTGFARSFHLVAQWFPKLAKLEKNGEWAHFSFHPHAEFYADFGDYDVTLDVPRTFVVGATGRRVTSREAGERRVDHFQANGVLDFAWTAWDGFDVSRRRIEDVDVELLVPRGSGPATSVSWDSLEHALPFFNRRFGRYPYPTLTVVYPPQFAGAAGGMEYPSFITTGGSPLWTWIGARTIEQVTVHELGHQWFQSLVATNEARYPFLDEGLNSYAEWIALEDRFGPASIGERFGLSVSLPAVGRWAALAYGKDEAIAQPASEFTGMRALGGVIYARTAAALSTLGNVYGEEKLTRAMSDYTARYRFASPTPLELLDTIRDDVSAEAAAALRKMLFERGWVDYAVRDLDSRSIKEGLFKSRVVVVRRGTLALPVTVRFSLANGEIIDRIWSGAEPTTVLEIEHGSPLSRATVDPEQKVLLDENRLNDTRRMSGSKKSGRTSERSLYWAELLLHLLGP